MARAPETPHDPASLKDVTREDRREAKSGARLDAAQPPPDGKFAARAAALRDNLRRRKAAARKAAPAPRDGGGWTE